MQCTIISQAKTYKGTHFDNLSIVTVQMPSSYCHNRMPTQLCTHISTTHNDIFVTRTSGDIDKPNVRKLRIGVCLNEVC